MLILLLYDVTIAIAELVAAFIAPLVGVLLHLIILVAVLLASYFLRRNTGYQRLFPVLLIAPLLRILSFVMPIQNTPQIYWYAWVGLPLLIATLLAVRNLGLTRADIGLQIPSRR